MFNFGHFLGKINWLGLILGSTYTRVYTVINISKAYWPSIIAVPLGCNGAPKPKIERNEFLSFIHEDLILIDRAFYIKNIIPKEISCYAIGHSKKFKFVLPWNSVITKAILCLTFVIMTPPLTVISNLTCLEQRLTKYVKYRNTMNTTITLGTTK